MDASGYPHCSRKPELLLNTRYRRHHQLPQRDPHLCICIALMILLSRINILTTVEWNAVPRADFSFFWELTSLHVGSNSICSAGRGRREGGVLDLVSIVCNQGYTRNGQEENDILHKYLGQEASILGRVLNWRWRCDGVLRCLLYWRRRESDSKCWLQKDL